MHYENCMPLLHLGFAQLLGIPLNATVFYNIIAKKKMNYTVTKTRQQNQF